MIQLTKRSGAPTSLMTAIVRVLRTGIMAALAFATDLAVATVHNDQIGFTPNHVFASALAGEDIDVMSGNVTLSIPLGPRYLLNEDFGYQVMLYYNSKIWEHDCRGVLSTQCHGDLVAPDDYGVGFRISFGKVYRDDRDRPNVYRYVSPSGAEHFFETVGSGFAVDGSGIQILRYSTDRWEALPGDGTRIIMERHVVRSLGQRQQDEWHATRVQSAFEPYEGIGFDITYVDLPPPLNTPTARIQRITDSQGRVIDFNYGSDITIVFPGFDQINRCSTTPDPITEATYTLRRQNLFLKDPIDNANPLVPRQVLTEIVYPELKEQDGETYRFRYDLDAPDTYGYLLERTLPTGARVEYHFNHYATGQHQPYHSELALKYLHSGGEVSRWSYTRFGDSLIRDVADHSASTEGHNSNATNPALVKVLDPFDNLTEYWFYSRQQTGCSTAGDCRVYWDDGLLYKTVLYAGSTLIQKTENAWEVDRVSSEPGAAAVMFRFRDDRGTEFVTDSYSVGVNPRVKSFKVTTPGGGMPFGLVRRAEYSDWTEGDIRIAKTVEEYDGSELYRTTYTDYVPDSLYHHQYRYVKQTDASGQVVSRSDAKFTKGALECSVRRTDGTGVEFSLLQPPACDSDTQLEVEPGDIVTWNTYDSTTGNRTATEIRGGDDGGVYTTDYTYAAGGYLRTSIYGSEPDGQLGWEAVHREIDLNTGLVFQSRDPAGSTVDYSWDLLGRLKCIAPMDTEKPTTIEYVSIHETRVRQDGDSGTDDYVETVYKYDDLGRLVETRKRTVNGGIAKQLTEYDIAGRVTRRSNWVDEEASESDMVWTLFDYTIATNPEPQPGEPENHPDPLGRIHRVTRPLTNEEGTTTTTYDGLTSSVTVSSIRGRASNGLVAYHTPTTVYTSDVFGRLQSVDSPGNGAYATYEYDELDNLTGVELSDGAEPEHVQARRFVYDKLGRLRQATNPESNTVEYVKYDARGNLLEWMDAKRNHFVSTYDAAGRLITKSVRQHVCDVSGNPCTTDAQCPTNPASETCIEGSVDDTLVRNTYDVDTGNLTAKESSQLVDGVSQLVARDEFLYGAADSAVPCTGVGEGIRGYKGLNGRPYLRRTRLYPWGAQLETLSCQDSQGLPYLTAYPDVPSSERDSRSRVARHYHNGFLWEIHDLGLRDLEYVSNVAYSNAGALTHITRGNGMMTQITRDAIDRPKRFKVTAPAEETGGGRPPLSELTIVGCGGGGGGIGPVYIQWCGSGGGTLPTVRWDSGDYEYDDAGNITSIGYNKYNLFYDELNRLIESDQTSYYIPGTWDSGYSYDAFGNLIGWGVIRGGNPNDSDSYYFDPDPATNRLRMVDEDLPTGYANKAVTYDENGNLTSVGSRGYLFDEQNRLRSVTDTTSGVIATYDYDASGYRVRAVADGVETYYFRDEAGQVLSEFARSADTTEPPVWNKDYVYGLGQVLNVIKNDVPAAPGKPWALPPPDLSPTHVRLNWEAVPEPDIAGYKLWRSYKLVDGGTFIPNQPVSIGNVTEYNATFTQAREWMKFWLQAVDEAGNASAESPELMLRPAGGPPPTPTGLAAQPTDRAVLLTWTAITTTDDDDILGYHVERQVSPNVWTQLNTMPLTSPTFLDLGLTNDTAYTYHVIAVDTAGRESTPSGSVTATPFDNVPPARPIGLTAEPGLQAGRIVLRWEAVTDPDLDSYRVYRRISTEPPVILTVDALANPTVSQYEDVTATPGSTYFYTLVALDTSDNVSAASLEVSARPRHPLVPLPEPPTAVFEVDPGTGTSPFPAGQGQSCLTTDMQAVVAEYNDVIQVRVTWLEVSGAVEYRIYRDADDSGVYKYLETETNPVHLDRQGDGSYYSYYVTAVVNIGGNEEESAASAVSTAWDQWPTDASVREVVATTSRDGYIGAATNFDSRYMDVWWSRVTERELVGYHVYRKCEWRWCKPPQTYGQRADDTFTCEPTWVRVTDVPVTDTHYRDDSIGGFKGCYVYAVRPVGPGFQEGPVSKILNATSQPEDIDEGRRCFADVDTHWFEYTGSGEEAERHTAAEEMNRMNGWQRVPGSAPGPPTLVRVSWGVKQDHFVTWSSNKSTKFATISWAPTGDNRLAGHHVEMAGSLQGPWKRLTRNPVAWWENRYVVQGLGFEQYCTNPPQYIGPADCAHFRVIAVDEFGNESAPAKPEWECSSPALPGVACTPNSNSHCAPGTCVPVYPRSGCSNATPVAPANLRAATADPGGPLGSGCTTRLEWDPVPGAVEYNIYRFPLAANMGPYFYRTQSQPATGTCSTNPSEACAQESDCASQGFGSCVGGGAVYIEEGDSQSSCGSDPDDLCPFYVHAGTPDIGPICETVGLEAFYVTARGDDGTGNPIGGESPRSNIVFWDCSNDPGYVAERRDTMLEEGTVMASFEAELPGLEWVGGLDTATNVCVQPTEVIGTRALTVTKVPAVAPKETAAVEVAAVGPGERMVDLATAGLVTLGQSTNPDPPWNLYDLHVDHLGSVRLVTTDDHDDASYHEYLPFGQELYVQQDYNTHMFTGHERDRETGLDYMMARYYGASLSRFLSTDPVGGSFDPGTWNAYTYANNNPIAYFDPDGQSPFKYWVRGVGKAYRRVKRSVAVRKAETSSHAVRVEGPGASKEARGIVKDAHPNKGTKRHDHDDPHWQPEKSVQKGGKNVGQVHYTTEGVVAAVAGAGAAAGSAVEAATGSETLGEVIGGAVDFINPATDIQEGAALVEEIGTDIIEAIYDVDLDEEEVDKEEAGEEASDSAEAVPEKEENPE